MFLNYFYHTLGNIFFFFLYTILYFNNFFSSPRKEFKTEENKPWFGLIGRIGFLLSLFLDFVKQDIPLNTITNK